MTTTDAAAPIDDAIAIHLSHVDQGYEGTIIVHDINLDVRRGEILALIGPSGSGKTTLISTIMGMIAAKSGTVTVLGKSMPDRQQLGSIGYMAQNDALYMNLTALENLRFFATVQGIDRRSLQQSIAQAAAVVKLQDVLRKPVKKFSGGMKRRLSLAIALVGDPPVLILDEPTVGIDPELRRQIWRELHQSAAAGKTILLTTHVMDDAVQADTLVMLRGGEAIAQGSPDKVIQTFGTSTLEEAFIQAGRSQDAHQSGH